MADGKVSLAYSRFLGYDKEPEKYTMVVNLEQAVTVRRIFFLFLQGYTPHTISKILTKEGVTAPAGGNVWNQQTYAECSPMKNKKAMLCSRKISR